MKDRGLSPKTSLRLGRRSSWRSLTRVKKNIACDAETEEDGTHDSRPRQSRRDGCCHVSRLGRRSLSTGITLGNKATPLPILLLFGLDVTGAQSRLCSPAPWHQVWTASIRSLERRYLACPGRRNPWQSSKQRRKASANGTGGVAAPRGQVQPAPAQTSPVLFRQKTTTGLTIGPGREGERSAAT